MQQTGSAASPRRAGGAEGIALSPFGRFARRESDGQQLVARREGHIPIWGLHRGEVGRIGPGRLDMDLPDSPNVSGPGAAALLASNAVAAHRDERGVMRPLARMRLLSEATALFAEASEPPQLLESVVRMLAEGIGDGCCIRLVSGESLGTTALWHVDAGLHRMLVERFRGVEFPLARHPIPRRVLERGESMLLPVLEPGQLGRSLPEELRAAVDELHATSALAVPMRARGRSIGLLTLVRSGGEPYGEEDRFIVQDVADRTALAIDNARLVREAREAVAVRDRFLAAASHELKTPFTPLKMNLESIRRSLSDSGAEEKLLRRLDASIRQTDRLLRLARDLLDGSLLAQRQLQLHLEEVDLAQLVRQQQDHLAEEASRKGIALEVRAPEKLMALVDPTRIEQLLASLLSNALKFGASKPVLLALEHRGDRAVLVVRDRGIGIPASDQERIFGRFERAAPDTHYAGLGLGLYLVQLIVEAHGGSISVESIPGAGTTFSVELPLRS